VLAGRKPEEAIVNAAPSAEKERVG
jgi:hypothetical protein